MNTNAKSNSKETSQAQNESRKVVIEYMPFNETEAKGFFQCISKYRTLV